MTLKADYLVRSWSLIDVRGKIVLEDLNALSISFTIDLSSQAKGLYTVQFTGEAGEGSGTIRVLVQ